MLISVSKLMSSTARLFIQAHNYVELHLGMGSHRRSRRVTGLVCMPVSLDTYTDCKGSNSSPLNWFNGQKPFCDVDTSDLLILVLLIEAVGRSGKPHYRVFGPMSYAVYPVFEAQHAGGLRGS